jgi:flavin reductase (DIM6/NTAB) family NADH-FMN oxidoreductase RutF
MLIYYLFVLHDNIITYHDHNKINNARERSTARMDKTAFHTLTYGLYILMTRDQERQNGCIVNTACQVTAEPPKLSVTVSKDSLTAEMIDRSGIFNISPLSQDASLKLIGNFGFRAGRSYDKFAMPLTTAVDMNNIKYVTDCTVAVFSCKVTEKLDVGTHMIFVGEVLSAEKLSSAPAMTYEYYRKNIKGLTPKNAPSYQAPAAAEAGGQPAATTP